MLKYYLCYLCNSSKNKGFTLVELLVVVIIIGVLAAIALPNFLNQVGKAREAEAVTAASTFLTQQQAYYYKKSEFTSDWDELGIDPEDAKYFTYSVTVADNEARFMGSPKDDSTRIISAGIKKTSKQKFITGICEATKPGKDVATIDQVVFEANNVRCGKGLRKL